MLSDYSSSLPSRATWFEDESSRVTISNMSGKINMPALLEKESEMTLSAVLPDNIQIAVDSESEDKVLSVGDLITDVIAEQLLALDLSTEGNFPAAVEIVQVDDVQIVAKAIIIDGLSIDKVLSSDTCVTDGGNVVQTSTLVLHIPTEKVFERGIRYLFGFDCVPLWGSVSVIGLRPEMEDAVIAVPRLLKIPTKLLSNDQVTDLTNEKLAHRTAHFFGVYDGHGGCQVANYCRDHVHSALLEEFNMIEDTITGDKSCLSSEEQWEKAFTGCFQKVDDEVGGISSQGTDRDSDNSCSEPIAPGTVGSTAVVALVCSSHIIVANCGDSRAVLFRGKEAKALSVDHKPEREDEYARIEASGGKVIKWNGYRIMGVLAMSRSIGDRFLKPWTIPKPEIMIIPRAKEDECLILATDGLWDVMTNEEACEAARKRILLWHKKNGCNPVAERGKEIDPAAQAAAEYLSMLAMQKGSKDNISVIVVDLKPQRKFKSKPHAS